MAETLGTFTVTGITATRTLDLSSASINDLANFIGTLIYDSQEGTYDGSTYTLTNGSVDRTFDTDSTSVTELFNVLGTAVNHESGDVFEPGGYTAMNYARQWVFDCTSTSLDELADVVATVLQFATFISPGRASMASVQLYQYFVIDIPGETPRKGGSLSRAKSISLEDGEVSDQTFKVGPATTVKIWDKTENEAMGDFNLLWLEADLDVLLQFTADAGGTDVYVVEELKGSGTANEMGVARVLNSNLMHKLDGSIDIFDGTEDTIDEIWAYNPDDTDTARVRRVVAT